jgi:hypothetical protein
MDGGVADTKHTPPRFPHRGVGPARVEAPIHNEKGGAAQNILKAETHATDMARATALHLMM